ncbi:preQ(1) synthase, partial [Desulfovibrio sp. OttesenSCG-928-C06]|nr:preQ(1) synthase [Desulfovibrio sp. OttesenSCG-928-C06]
MSKTNNQNDAGQTQSPETAGLSKLGSPTKYRFDSPDVSLLEAFPNRYPGRNYVITFEHPEFTSLCPMTGQPDFGTITIRYVPGEKCVESKSFKLYMGAFRNHGSFMESLTNKIADDMIELLAPRRITVEGVFNVRGGTGISIRVEHLDPGLSDSEKTEL